jgi:hypothetical protein
VAEGSHVARGGPRAVATITRAAVPDWSGTTGWGQLLDATAQIEMPSCGPTRGYHGSPSIASWASRVSATSTT